MAQVLETFLSDTFITEVHCASHRECEAKNMWFFSNHIKYACCYFLASHQRDMDVVGVLEAGPFPVQPGEDCFLAGWLLESVPRKARPVATGVKELRGGPGDQDPISCVCFLMSHGAFSLVVGVVLIEKQRIQEELLTSSIKCLWTSFYFYIRGREIDFYVVFFHISERYIYISTELYP